jgi:endonuclease/exonuclease/phosphatase (EEP) superfamily protein YafD
MKVRDSGAPFRWRARVKACLRRIVAVSAFAYPIALLGALGLLRIVGERHWLTSVALYLPQIAFLAPLPFISAGLLLVRLRGLLWTQVLAALIGLFPLMGLVLPLPTFGTGGATSVRILSFNVNSGYAGYEAVGRGILAESPDIVLVQELSTSPQPLVDLLKAHYGTVETSTQFLIASRFPVESTTDPPRIPYYGKLHAPRFLRYTVDTSIGRLVIYNVHPTSPRGGFYALRGRGLLRETLSGRLLAAENAASLQENSGLRSLQVKEFSDLAAAESDPTLLAGDTNLPNGSPLLRRYLSRYDDGFTRAGFGFGYTFPSSHPWMRLDRILATPDLRFTGFSVDCAGLSDHRCVVAAIERN